MYLPYVSALFCNGWHSWPECLLILGQYPSHWLSLVCDHVFPAFPCVGFQKCLWVESQLYDHPWQTWSWRQTCLDFTVSFFTASMSNHLAHIIFLHHSPSITHFLIVLGSFIYNLQSFILLTWVTVYSFDFLLNCFCLQNRIFTLLLIHPYNGQDCESCIF